MTHRFLLAVVTALGLSASALAQTAPTPLEARYDTAIPDPETVLGHDFGVEITPPEDAIDYIRTLAQAAPSRMQVFDYAESWEGRPLAYAVIGSEENMARLDDIRSDLQQIADPRGLSNADRDALIARLPVIVWLGYGVHGDEISSTDAGLRTAYHLLAASNDPVADMIRENALVIIDPVQNPDGRNRFLNSFTQARGLQADGYRYSAEHDQPWPGGRNNHYLFDMNRDWFIMTQPETRGRTAAMLDWRPMVIVDAHEMGGDQTYFFPPVADPVNPVLSDGQLEGHDIIGQNHAMWFDRIGSDYFTREVFDAFYPGYGDTWPMLQGGVAMTYEQGSARGLVWTRRNGGDLTYADGVTHHFIASLSTAQAAAQNRERFVRGFYDVRASAGSAQGPAAIVLSRETNRWGTERLARLIARQGIDISRIAAGTTACGTALPQGGFFIDLNQPGGQLARTLLERDTPLPEDFLEDQEDRRTRGLDHELYDVTAWSLPVMFNVRATECASRPNLSGEAVHADDAMPAEAADSARFGYVIPWTDAGQARLVAALAAEGVPMRTAGSAFTIEGETWPEGSVVVARTSAPANLDSLMRLHARTIGAVYAGLDTSWTEDGPNFGSGQFADIVSPRIAMAWGEGTDPNSAGGLRYVLEQRYGLPVTVIRTATLARADLSGFDVLILPEQRRGGYTAVLGETGAARLSRFAQAGGTLIALGDATRFITGPDINLLPLRRERAADTPADAGAGESALVAGSVIADDGALQAALEPRNAGPDTSPGALLNVTANPDAFLAAGYAEGAAAMVTGSDIYTAVPLDEADTVLRFAGPDALVASGYLWQENIAQTAYKPFMVSRRTGAGFVIAFTQDPAARGYQEGLDLALLNAVLLAPARSLRLR